MTRETWLVNAVSALEDRYFPSNVPVRVSVGWPSVFALSKRKRRIGECWKPESTKDGVPHIFVSPILEEPVIVLAVLLHELIHARYPEAGHKGIFVEEARRLGLEPPWTATIPGDELIGGLKELAETLGDYPHSALVPIAKQDKVQTTRLIKLIADDCGYTVRTTRKWIEAGLPSCPCGQEMHEEKGEETKK